MECMAFLAVPLLLQLVSISATYPDCSDPATYTSYSESTEYKGLNDDTPWDRTRNTGDKCNLIRWSEVVRCWPYIWRSKKLLPLLISLSFPPSSRFLYPFPPSLLTCHSWRLSSCCYCLLLFSSSPKIAQPLASFFDSVLLFSVHVACV